MADTTNSNGNGSRVEAAAESALLRLVARWMMAAVVPALLVALGALGSIAASEVWASVQRTNAAVTRLELIITANTGTQNVLNSRLDAHSRRLDQHDTDIDRLRERLYSLPPRAPTP